LVVNKKQCTFTLSPSVILTYTALVQKHFGNNQVSAQVELLIRGENARLGGDLDGYLHSIVRNLRDVAEGIPNPDSKDQFTKNIDNLEIWVANARGIQFAATDVATNYEQLQCRYVGKVKRCDELVKVLKAHGSYDDLMDLAEKCGLDLNTEMDNLKEVVTKMLPNRTVNPGHLQLFFNVLELAREKRLIERDLTAIQRQKYEGPDVKGSDVQVQVASFSGFHDAP
jgi:hypothetical protein